MSQNPQEKPEPPAFPAVNRQPMTRREAREAREAQEAKEAQGAQEARAAQEPPSSHASDPAAVPADERNPRTPGPWTPPPAETSAQRKTLAGLDFDSVVTGPIAVDADADTAVSDRETVAASARHEATHGTAAGDHGRFDNPVHAIFSPLSDDRGEVGGRDPEHPLAWRQQNYVSHEKPPKRKRRWVKPFVITVVIIAVLGGLAGGAYAAFQPQVAKLITALSPVDNDYTGNGTGQVVFTIKSGDTGGSIATNLQKAGVTKSYDAFYQLLLRQHPEVEFQPGVFKLAKGMSAQAALTALQDPANRMQNTAVIPEGTAEKDALQTVSEATKIPLAELQQAAANPAEYGLPAQATTLEGFLFPATYTFPPGATAHDVIKTMVDRSFQSLDEAGVAPADRWNTVVLASIVQREAGLKDDYPKVSRVFLNRLAQGWDLQSDATVAYGTGNTQRVETTDAEREDASNPYNTYVHPGLPVGPISNPGDLAINAVVHPADGPWMFFVTWNLKTGETIFSTTVEEHDAAVAKWKQWMKDNPGYE